jgi:hypothetical protein
VPRRLLTKLPTGIRANPHAPANELDGYFSLKWIPNVKRTTAQHSVCESFARKPTGISRPFGIEFLVAPKKLVGYYSPWFKPKSKTEENTVV